MWVHQLQQIVVAAEDDHVDALLDGLDRQRADNVISLVSLDLEQRHLHRFEDASAPDDLIAHPGRGRRARALVLGKIVQPKRRPAHVERGGRVLRLQILHRLQQHAGEGVHAGGQLTLCVRKRASQLLQRVKAAIDERVPVNQHDHPLSHFAGSRRCHPGALRPIPAARPAAARFGPGRPGTTPSRARRSTSPGRPRRCRCSSGGARPSP